MGMYTQLHLGVTLKKETPDEVINILKFMVGDGAEEQIEVLPRHELFVRTRWRFMLRCDSYYFNYKTHHLLKFDDIGQHWWFNVTTNLKNYENEIDLFLDWISQYIEDPMGDNMWGFTRYEEDSLPNIITWNYIKLIKNQLLREITNENFRRKSNRNS